MFRLEPRHCRPSLNDELLRRRKASLPGEKRADARAQRRGPGPIEEEIYRLVTEAIVNKQIRAGGRLKEAALATQFAVSRARVRGVLQRLAELDIVEFKLNDGALVRRPKPDEARAVFATRRLLEAEAVRGTARHAEAGDFARLRAFVRDENRAFQNKGKGLAALSSGFHTLLGELCGIRCWRASSTSWPIAAC